MTFHVEFIESARKSLKKLDVFTQRMILSWVRKNLEGCDNPRQHGKALSANRAGQWRYRVGDYRLIAQIEEERLLILVISVGHRRDVYKN